MLQTFIEFLTAVWQEFLTALKPSLRLCDPASLERDLKGMLVRGEIDLPAYQTWRGKIRRQAVGRGDLDLFQQRVQRQLEGPARVSPQRWIHPPAVRRSLKRLERQRIDLIEAREVAQDAWQRLEAQRTALDGEIAAHWQAAQAALPDEIRARAALERRYARQADLERLAQRQAALEAAMARNRELQARLAQYEREVWGLAAQARLAAEELAVRESELR